MAISTTVRDHVSHVGAGLVLLGLILIGSGLGGGSQSTRIRAVGNTILVTWDNGHVQMIKDLLDTDDPHVTAVRIWGGSVCWITVNDVVADARDEQTQVVCTWSRG